VGLTGDTELADRYFGGSANRLGAMAGGLGRLALDAGSAELYYRTRLFSPGAAEQFFGAGQRRFGQDLTMLGNAFTGGAGQPLGYRVGYTFGNAAQIATMFSKLGEARTLAEVGTVGELTAEARAARTMSEAALLRGAGAEGQPAAALFQELEVACKKPPVGVAQMEARAQLAQKLESEAAAELKATAQTAEADVASAELVQSEFPFTQENLSGNLASSDAAAQEAAKNAPVVIGENMAGRVNPYARNIGGYTIDDWLASRQWSQSLNDQFIATMKAQGREFIDIGPDFGRRLQNHIDPALGRPPSSVYGGESRELQNYNNYRRVYDRTGKYQGGAQGFDL
jgi:hypothetical protein